MTHLVFAKRDLSTNNHRFKPKHFQTHVLEYFAGVPTVVTDKKNIYNRYLCVERNTIQNGKKKKIKKEKTAHVNQKHDVHKYTTTMNIYL